MNFFKRLLRNKIILSLSCFVVLGFIFFPLIASAAGPLDFITGAFSGAANDLAKGIIGAIFGILMTIPLTILNVALDLLNWVASGDFLVISFTGADNTVVTTAWTFVRNIANVILIFGLVLIALSIILGYQETKAKKMLVDFILIAILINFTPVICGLVIDVAKIIMDLLLKGGAPPSFVTFITTKIQEVGLADIPTLFVLTAFCIFAAVVYFLFALLFLVRVVMLWILIILSPIAFATKVLPQSKYITAIFPRICQWDEWWNNFLQWTFMGIPAAGAIWLSNLIMFTIAQNPNAITSTPQGNILSGTLGLLFAYTIPFIVLVVGFFASLDQGGAVGTQIKGLANKAVGTLKGAPFGAAAGFVSGAAAGEGVGRLTGAFKGSAQGIMTGGEREKQQIGRWYQRSVKERLGLTPEGTTAGEKGKDISKLSATYKNLEDAELQRITEQTATTDKNIDEKIAGIITTIERGNNVRDEEITWIEQHRENLQRRGADLHKVAEYAPELSGRITPATTAQTVTGMSNKKFQETVRGVSLNNFDVITSSSHGQIKETLEKGSPEQINNIRGWVLNPAQRRQLVAERDRLDYLLSNYRAPMPGVPVITPQEAIEAERRINNIDHIIVEIGNSLA